METSSSLKNLSDKELDRMLVDLICSMNPEQLRKAAEMVHEAEEKEKAHTKYQFVQAK
jgi:hypothetical protein